MAWQWVEFLRATMDSSYVPAVYRKGVPKGATAEDIKKLSKEANKYNDDMKVVEAGYVAFKGYLDREAEYAKTYASITVGDGSYQTPINRSPNPTTLRERLALSKEANEQNRIIQEIAPNIESMVVNDIPFILTVGFDGGACAAAAGGIVDARLAAMGEAPASHLGKLAVSAKNMLTSSNAPTTTTSEMTTPTESGTTQNVEPLAAKTSGEAISEITSPADNANLPSQAGGNKSKPSLWESIGSNFATLGNLAVELVKQAYESAVSLFETPKPKDKVESLIAGAKNTAAHIVSETKSGLPDYIDGGKPIENMRGR